MQTDERITQLEARIKELERLVDRLVKRDNELREAELAAAEWGAV